MSAAIADQIGQIAQGLLRAQQFIGRMREDKAVPAEVVHELHQVQVEFGVDSIATRAFLVELAKRCR